MDRIKNAVREVLKVHREVEEWREEYDPGTAEWHTLIHLSEISARLAFALPVEMLPEEEVRTPNPREYELLDELIATVNEAADK